jgi:hypothetical protein
MTVMKTVDSSSWVALLLSLLLFLLSVYVTWENEEKEGDAQRYQHKIEQTFPFFEPPMNSRL